MGDHSIPLNDAENYQPNGDLESHDKKKVDTSCGLGPCKPKCMQPFANIKLFTASLALLIAFYGALSTYVVSVLTTIERAFGFPSSKSGFITSTNDIGFLITVIPVSYLASRAHKPTVIAISGLFIGASGVISALPYFIWGGGMVEREPSTQVNVAFNTTEVLTPQMALIKSSLCKIRNESVYTSLNTTEQCGEETDEMAQRSTGAYVILVLAQVIIGTAASTLWSLGMTFIDDNVKKHVSSIYLGILFSLRTLSPILGFVLGAVFTSKPVDLKPTNLTPLDPQWVGAWWVGFLACGVIIFLAAIPLLFFPRQLPFRKDDPEKRRKKEEKQANKKQKKRPFVDSPMMGGGGGGGGDEKIDLKGFLSALKRLMTNKMYVLLVLVTCLALFVVSGLAAFKPKYTEHQFGLSASKSNMIIGICAALPAFIGSGASGIIMTKLKLDIVGTAKFCTILYIIVAVCQSMLILFGCPQPATAGFNGVESSKPAYFNGDNSTSCEETCGCADTSFTPVCSDDVMYYSACHAGCQTSQGSAKMVHFSNCSCIPNGGDAVSGVCDTYCGMLIPYCVFLFFGALAGGMSIVPKIIISIRVVEPRDKALSIGITMFCFSIFCLGQGLKRLFINPVYMSIITSLIFAMFGFIGFFTFIPKYLEMQFDITASRASMFLAVLSALPSALGTFCSGIMTSRLRLDHVGLAKVNLIFGLISFACRVVFLFLGCPASDIHGLTTNDVYNFTDTCNQDCGCAVRQYGPVCGSDGETYFTPCHAGCLGLPDAENNTFLDCGCIPDGRATLGPCVEKCHTLIPFGITLLLTTFISGLGMLPGIMLNLRSMEDRDKALGLGFLMFIFSIVGIPSPVVFGHIIDSVCLIHSKDCKGIERCLVYDKTPLKNLMFGVMLVSLIPGLCLGVFIYIYLARKKRRTKKNGGEALAALADQGNVETCDITKLGQAPGDSVL